MKTWLQVWCFLNGKRHCVLQLYWGPGLWFISRLVHTIQFYPEAWNCLFNHGKGWNDVSIFKGKKQDKCIGLCVPNASLLKILQLQFSKALSPKLNLYIKHNTDFSQVVKDWEYTIFRGSHFSNEFSNRDFVPTM